MSYQPCLTAVQFGLDRAYVDGLLPPDLMARPFAEQALALRANILSEYHRSFPLDIIDKIKAEGDAARLEALQVEVGVAITMIDLALGQ